MHQNSIRRRPACESNPVARLWSMATAVNHRRKRLEILFACFPSKQDRFSRCLKGSKNDSQVFYVVQLIRNKHIDGVCHFGSFDAFFKFQLQNFRVHSQPPRNKKPHRKTIFPVLNKILTINRLYRTLIWYNGYAIVARRRFQWSKIKIKIQKCIFNRIWNKLGHFSRSKLNLIGYIWRRS